LALFCPALKPVQAKPSPFAWATGVTTTLRTRALGRGAPPHRRTGGGIFQTIPRHAGEARPQAGPIGSQYRGRSGIVSRPRKTRPGASDGAGRASARAPDPQFKLAVATRNPRADVLDLGRAAKGPMRAPMAVPTRWEDGPLPGPQCDHRGTVGAEVSDALHQRSEVAKKTAKPLSD
jgi:hypothetical protein